MYLDITTRVEAIQLIEKFEHSTLDLTLTARIRIITLGTDCVNFIDKDDRRRMLFGDTEQFPYQLWTVSLFKRNTNRELNPNKF